MRTKSIRLEPGRPSGTSYLAWGGTMFRTGRFSAPGLAVILVAALAAAGCSSQAGPALSTGPASASSKDGRRPGQIAPMAKRWPVGRRSRLVAADQNGLTGNLFIQI